MNGKIRELAEQAGYKHPDAAGECEKYAYFDYEKFANLIIKDVTQEMYEQIQLTFSIGLANEFDEIVRKQYSNEGEE